MFCPHASPRVPPHRCLLLSGFSQMPPPRCFAADPDGFQMCSNAMGLQPGDLTPGILSPFASIKQRMMVGECIHWPRHDAKILVRCSISMKFGAARGNICIFCTQICVCSASFVLLYTGQCHAYILARSGFAITSVEFSFMADIPTMVSENRVGSDSIMI